MNNNVSIFFDKYRRICEKFHHSQIHIPKPDPKNGVPGKGIVLMFINERPGRIGTGKSDMISFDNSDPTARHFKYLFNTFNISRKKIFITNTCIYYPTAESYRDNLSSKEIKFSLPILRDQINRVNPKILVPLGNKALGALKKIYPQSMQLKHYKLMVEIGKPITDNNPYVFPLYHTAARAKTKRTEKDQIKDWQLLKKFMSRIKK